MPWFGRGSGDEDAQVALLRDALLFALARLAERSTSQEADHLGRITERLARPPAPTGLLRELQRTLRQRKVRSGGGGGGSVLPEASSAALRHVAHAAFASCLIDGELEAQLQSLRDGIPPRVGPGDARRVAALAKEVWRHAMPVRQRAVEDRAELVNLVTELARELSLLADHGDRIHDEIATLSRTLARAVDPAGLRAARQELVTQVRALGQSAESLKAELNASRARSARLEERLAATEAELVDVRDEAARDALTGLLNRGALDTVLAEVARRTESVGQPLGLVMVDVDHFKRVNDTRGHPAGDAALQAVAGAVVGQVRVRDLVGRYGGEELLLVLPGATELVAGAVAERVRAAVEATEITFEEQSFSVTVSCGVAVRREDEGLRKHLKRADAALYVAKETGRNRVHVDVEAPPEEET